MPEARDTDERYQDILLAAEREAEKDLYDAGVAVQIGYLDQLYATKRYILRTKYGVNWREPRQ